MNIRKDCANVTSSRSDWKPHLQVPAAVETVTHTFATGIEIFPDGLRKIRLHIIDANWD